MAAAEEAVEAVEGELVSERESISLVRSCCLIITTSIKALTLSPNSTQTLSLRPPLLRPPPRPRPSSRLECSNTFNNSCNNKSIISDRRICRLFLTDILIPCIPESRCRPILVEAGEEEEGEEEEGGEVEAEMRRLFLRI